MDYQICHVDGDWLQNENMLDAFNTGIKFARFRDKPYLEQDAEIMLRSAKACHAAFSLAKLLSSKILINVSNALRDVRTNNPDDERMIAHFMQTEERARLNDTALKGCVKESLQWRKDMAIRGKNVIRGDEVEDEMDEVNSEGGDEDDGEMDVENDEVDAEFEIDDRV